MGKAEEVQHLPSTAVDAPGTTPSAGSRNGCCLTCSRVKKLVTFKCVLVLVLGVAVLLSAIFWLPFFHFGDPKDQDLEYAGHGIVASFMLSKPASFLENYSSQLEDDIFDEMSFSSTKVEILSLESSAGSNITKVVFAVQSDVTTQSLIRDSFVSLITHQTSLQLTGSLFGDPFSFDVLKFRGGITVIPDQKAFLIQSVQIIFNFTLNFSVDQIINNFDELTSQLKMGLHLVSYENLYITLNNLKGSTVDPPTTVQSQVLLAVGINPSKSRLKQLAQTISGSHSKNLGLNNHEFGRVKQVSLSSVLQHSLGNDGSSPSPSLSPSPSSMSISHQHHHRQEAPVSPSVSPSPSIGSGGSATGMGSPMSTPVPAPAPEKNKAGEPPACHFGYNNKFPWKHKKHSPMAPSAPPVYAPHAAASQSNQADHVTPRMSPAPVESLLLPNVAYIQHQPPSHGEYHSRPPDVIPLVSPWPSPSSAGTISYHIWTLPLFILLGLCL